MDTVKACSSCNQTKELSDFPKTKHGRICRACKNSKQRLSRKLNGDMHTKVYEKTPTGYLMRTYRNMLSRVSGVQHRKAHLYSGLEILSKEEFYAWAIINEEFLTLYEAWVESGFEHKLSPSIDRRDSSRGYSLENMRWITHSLNSRLGALSRKKVNPLDKEQSSELRYEQNKEGG